MRNIFFLFLFATGICLIQSCQQAPTDIPFQKNETEFAQPVTVPYKFSEPKKISWEIHNGDNIRQVSGKRIDFKTLPSEPFDIGDFHPLPKPIEEVKLNWNHLPDTVFDLSKIPSHPFTFKISALGQPTRTKAQRPRVRDNATRSIFEWGLDQGLSTGGGLGAIFQDSRGFLWISSQNGLYRFDGENFDLFTPASGLNNFDNIETLSEDSQGQIWTCNTNGIDIINLEQGIVKHLGTAEGLIGNETRSVMEDSQGNIWICTTSSLDLINPKNETIQSITTAQGLSDNETLGIIEDDFGNIWIGTNKGVSIINVKNKTIKKLSASEGLTSDHFVWALDKDEKGRILIGALGGGGVNVIDLKNGTLKRIGKAQGLGSDKIQALIPDRHGHLWIADRKGLDIIDVDSGKIRHLTTADGLTSNYIDRLLKDNQDHIWMSCGYAELDVVDLNEGSFKRQDSKLSMTGGAVMALYEDSKARVWIANSRPRFYIADAEAGTIKYIDSAVGMKITPSRFAEGEKDQIWIDTYSADANSRVYLYDLKTGIVKHLVTANGPKAYGLSGLVIDKPGRVWIWGDGGVLVYDPPNHLYKSLSSAGGLSNKKVYSCMEDDEGNIWIATEEGVDVLDPKMETIKSLTNHSGQRIKNVVNIAGGEKGKLLMRTYGYGFYIIDQKTDQISQFTTREGLVSDQVTSVIEKNGCIYAGTSEGLTILTPDTQNSKTVMWRAKTFEKPQLFDHVDFNPTVMLRKNGQLWWGVGGEGVIILDEAGKDTVIPNPFITRLDIMEQPEYFSNAEMPANKQIKLDSVSGPWKLPVNLSLPYNQNYIRFHFTGTHLGNIEKTRYRFILEGKDSSWSNITDQSFASFINLSPGKYIFKVASRGFNGLWSHPAEMSFTIRLPWWETWWAYLLFFVAAVMILWGGITIYRSGQVKAENLRLEVKVLERTKELKLSLEDLRSTQNQLIQSEKMASLGELTAGIAHEIQNPLNFVNNFSDVNKELLEEMKEEIKKGNLDELNTLANNIIENEEKINHHGKRADSIVKGMLQHSRSSSGVKEPTDINALADEYLRLAYHGLRAKDKSFNASMKKDYDKTVGIIPVISQDIGRVFLNLYNNAFYAVDKKNKTLGGHYDPTVSVSTKKTADKILISVKDNGNGIPPKVIDKIFQPFFTTKPPGQGTGLGLSLSYDIIRAHGGEMKVYTTEGEGSEFVVQLPMA